MTGGPPRVTYIGWFLQLTGLEDLPQYSVALLGKVIVGSEPRPSTSEQGPFLRDLYEEVLPSRVVKAKRLADVLCAVAGLTVLAFVFIPIALAIKVDSKGPVFYRQRRVGRSLGTSTTLFDIIKFRTMHDSAELESGPVWAAKHDSRVTRVGRFLRDTRLDELPQFINVLRGDMSVVGPRPERPKFVNQLQKAIPFYTERLYGVRPGITGLAQVNQPYDTSIDDVRKKVAFDHAYALQLGSMRMWMRVDAGIMLKTIGVMLGRKGL
jgi:lipopolysaccharide/colanic/teichoic acid biosynthesis glycosyltransferase